MLRRRKLDAHTLSLVQEGEEKTKSEEGTKKLT
jgi:hypothetical protein